MSLVDKEGLLKRVRQGYRDSTSHLNRSNGNLPGWLDEAEMAFDYASGKQWSIEDHQAMLSSRRAPITANKIDPYIDAVVGVAINNAQEIKFFPRGGEDAGYSEFLTDIHDYVAENGDFESEELEAFRDMLLCGMGWTDTMMDYTNNLDGDIERCRLDPLRCRWDPSASKRNLSDARWVLVIKDLTIEEIKDKYDVEVGNYANAWDPEIDLIGYGNRIIETREDYGRTTRHRTEPRSIEHVGFYQYKVPETVYRVATPEGIKELSKEDYGKVETSLRERGWRSKKQQKWIVRQAVVLGDQVLSDDIAPNQERFSFQVMTGKYDRMSGTWYGIVRAIMHPQQWVNKFMSTMLHLISGTPKGGLVAEMSVFSDIRDAENKWNRSDTIILVNDGSIAENRLMPKPIPPYPAGIDRLLELTQTSLKESAGISPEMMGMTESVQPGVVESQRRQASIAILAWAFDSLRLYRKQAARLCMDFIREYISDGRLVRVHGDAAKEYIPLLKERLSITYDVIADESPSSPNVKERTWLVLIELLPHLLSVGLPIPPEVIDYIPIPESLKEAWKKQLSPPEKSPEQLEAERKQQELQQRAIEAEISDKESGAVQKQSVAQLNQAKIQEIAAQLNISEEELRIKLIDVLGKQDQGADDSNIKRLELQEKRMDRESKPRVN